MSSTASDRPAVTAGSAEQRARRSRILRVAAKMAMQDGFDGVQMQEIARESGVAIATLYRYFPSKGHLYSAVMRSRIDKLERDIPEIDPLLNPAERVARFLESATHALLARPLLADALTRANLSASTDPDSVATDYTFRNQLLRVAGVKDPTERDVQIAGLITRCWYGVLVAHLNGRSTQDEAIAELWLTCELLLAEH